MKIRKKLTAAVLMSAALMGAGLTAKPLFPLTGIWEITAFAEETVVQGELTFRKHDTYAELEKCGNTATDVEIPSTVDGLPVTTIGPSAFTGCFSMIKVTLPDTLTSIGDNAFFYCNGLTSITLPDSVTSIGVSAFRSSGLTSVTIPDGVTEIQSCAFADCNSLRRVEFGKNVTRIGYGAFFDCLRLQSMTIPDSVKIIDEQAFFNCEQMTDLTIGNGVTEIGKTAFKFCTALKNLTIGNSVSKIGYEAFGKCEQLTSVTLPYSLTSIDDRAFFQCTELTDITIPDGVTNIGYSVFWSCDHLTISGTVGSKAEQYAAKNEIPFRAISSLGTVTLSKTTFPYTGKAVKVGSYIKVRANGTALKYGKDFIMIYANNETCGVNTASVTIQGIGDYLGSVTKYYSIVPKQHSKPKLSTKKGYIRVDWTVDINAEGYQVQYCKDASFSGDSLHSASFTANAYCNLVTYPKAGETWYVRIRSYIKDNAGKRCGIWSGASSITVGTIDSVTLSQTEFAYTGKAVKVGKYITVTSGGTKLKYDQDFTLEYKNNVKKGTATVTAVGIGAYEGSSASATYSIK